MNDVSPRRRPEDDADAVRLFWRDRPLSARAGESLAAALLAAGITTFRRHPVNGAPRGPFCLMGACYECLVRVDGVDSLQACMLPVREGMRAEPQAGGARLDED